MNRRDLLKSAGSAVGLTILESGALRGRSAPSDKLNVALIGVWGRGTAHYDSLRNENVVALCDVNDLRTKEALAIFPKAKTYWDWRRVLDQKDVEAVVICTAAGIPSRRRHAARGAALRAMDRGVALSPVQPAVFRRHQRVELPVLEHVPGFRRGPDRRHGRAYHGLGLERDRRGCADLGRGGPGGERQIQPGHLPREAESELRAAR